MRNTARTNTVNPRNMKTNINALCKFINQMINKIKLTPRRDREPVFEGYIYIVEDTTTSYWKEYNNNLISPVEFFKTLIDEVHFKGERGR